LIVAPLALLATTGMRIAPTCSAKRDKKRRCEERDKKLTLTTA
jgi:hypothetical protein